MVCQIMKKYFPLIFQRSKGIIADSSRLLVLSSKHHSGWGFLAPMCTAGSNIKNTPKIWFKKFVKLMVHTCACNDLTNFACSCNDLIRKLCEIAETYMEKLVKTHCVNLFSASFRVIQS
jgi:hypothetical protein